MSERIVRTPFLVSADDRPYVHWTYLPRDDAFEAYKGKLNKKTLKIVSDEVGEIDPSADEIVIHGTAVWAGVNQSTVSLAEYGITRDHIKSVLGSSKDL